MKVSKLGYNFVRDLFREGKLLTQGDLSHFQPSISRAIINLTSKIPDRITAIMNNAIPKHLAVIPSQLVQYRGVGLPN